MVDLNVTLKTFVEDKNITVYKMVYNRETYIILVVHDGKFHNRLYKCEKEIPEELEWFLHYVIEQDLKEKGF